MKKKKFHREVNGILYVNQISRTLCHHIQLKCPGKDVVCKDENVVDLGT